MKKENSQFHMFEKYSNTSVGILNMYNNLNT